MLTAARQKKWDSSRCERGWASVLERPKSGLRRDTCRGWPYKCHALLVDYLRVMRYATKSLISWALSLV